MEYLAQLLTSFVGAAGFGIIFNIPKEAIIRSGITGMCGWICYYVLSQNGVDLFLATATASTLIAVMSQAFARLYKMPMVIFIVGGIIPLVPGGLAYDAMRNFVLADYSLALSLAARATLISGSIALGLVLSEALFQIYKRLIGQQGQ